MHNHRFLIDWQILRLVVATHINILRSPLDDRIVDVVKLYRNRLWHCTRTIEGDVHFIVVVPLEHLLVCHRDLIPAVLVVYRSLVSCVSHRKIHYDAGLALEDTVVCPVVRIDICSERHVLVVFSRIPCEIRVIGLGRIPYLRCTDLLCLACLCKEICVIRHVPEVIKTSVRAVCCREVLELNLIWCSDVDHHLCGSTGKKCIKHRIVCIYTVIENDRRSTVCIHCYSIHEEIFRSPIYRKTAEMKVQILLLLVHKVIICLDGSKVRLRKSTVCDEIYIESLICRKWASLDTESDRCGIVYRISARIHLGSRSCSVNIEDDDIKVIHERLHVCIGRLGKTRRNIKNNALVHCHVKTMLLLAGEGEDCDSRY